MRWEEANAPGLPRKKNPSKSPSLPERRVEGRHGGRAARAAGGLAVAVGSDLGALAPLLLLPALGLVWHGRVLAGRRG